MSEPAGAVAHSTSCDDRDVSNEPDHQDGGLRQRVAPPASTAPGHGDHHAAADNKDDDEVEMDRAPSADADDPSKPHSALGNDGAVSAIMAGAKYMFFLQLFSKVITFGVTQLLLRYVSPQVYGVSGIQLELLVSTVLVFSREAIRLAVVRIPTVAVPKGAKIQVTPTMQRIVNAAWIAPAIGSVLTVLMALYYTTYLRVDDLPYYTSAVWMYAFGTWLDLLAEPIFLVGYHLMYIRLRNIVEGLALTMSCVVACALAVYDGDNLGLLVFSWARISFGATFFLGFFMYFAASGDVPMSTFLPKRINDTVKDKPVSFYIDPSMVSIAWSFTKQSVLKHFLTEGDKFVLSLFFTPYHQGVYAIVFNYGSTVARLVFWPIEEAARVMFSNLGATQPQASRKIISLTVKFNIFLGLLFIAIGTHYTDVFVAILVGSKWSSGAGAPSAVELAAASILGSNPTSSALAAYCWYIPIMGINGITEAFVASTASPDQLNWQNLWLVVCTALMGAASYLFFPLGATGLVLANCANLLARAAWSSRFILQFFAQFPAPIVARHRMSAWEQWSACFPSRTVVNAFALSWVVTRWSQSLWPGSDWTSMAAHVAVGTGCTVLCLFMIVWRDGGFLQQIMKLRRGEL
ncbi:hypothetical protein AMAG_03165 [Allomyces macrogynus ATCC 38327]|uniref:Man(5)GlcNAc(2)-PP-dolichol translocation protein RFT1 n=1 Tax=Allomyces macrogynus (strain ATCC 38327) TaxID=578462 RepID=A0A0L0S525_ALLM3|nr:hypothetical protein AMAG_03165 [Allomyces macrogynus ATCC 38327]|eukprot:KNE57454.1 hypothetical protein AMAG_03165 [Allomyces macrogynus ATCC 38327]